MWEIPNQDVFDVFWIDRDVCRFEELKYSAVFFPATFKDVVEIGEEDARRYAVLHLRHIAEREGRIQIIDPFQPPEGESMFAKYIQTGPSD